MSRKQRAIRNTPDEKPPSGRSSPLRYRILLVLLVALLVCGGLVFGDWWVCLPQDAQATYVGSQACVDCHQEYYDQWKGSHHDLAMDRATPDTVLGDFDDVRFEEFGIESRLYRQGDKYMVHTEGPDGEMADFEVKYVFGVTPLQQYMVEFDRPKDMPDCEVARLQVLRISWDTERGEWFYLRPPDVDERLAPDDDLHWTGIAQRWNNMCADCHSTNLQKNYDVETKTYHSTFSEINVGCEMCHGPSSLHVELADSNSLFWDRKRGYGLIELKDDAKTQIHTCAPCHSRRRVVHPGFQPGDDYYDYFANELLGRETYHADGQILDEVYVYASFIQSKMYHNKIRCTDCHDPHTVRLKEDGNKVCTSCHQHPAGKYDSPAHHHHQPDSTGASCAECHMPETTYMAVDPRRDHSIRNPRPDLSVALGTPNACTRCHLEIEKEKGKVDLNRDDLDQYLDWILAARNGDQEVKEVLLRIDAEMQESCDEWYGAKPRQPRRKKHFAFVLDAARRGEPTAERELVDVVDDGRVPGIVRATALTELAAYGTRLSTSVSVRCLDDSDPQVQVAAIGNLQGRLDDPQLIRSLVPLLQHPLRVVRTEAARVLAAVPAGALRGADRQQLKNALAEFEKGLMLSNDRAAAHMTMGILHESLGEEDRALDAYETAIRVEPTVTGPRTNLAALCDRLAEAADRRARQAGLLANRKSEAEAAQEAMDYRERAAKLRCKELEWLARDAKLVPNSAALQYRYGMSLYLHRRLEEAERALVSASELEPNNPQFLLGVVLFYKELNQADKAIPLAERLVELRPQDAMFRQVLDEIRRQKELQGRVGPSKL